MSRQKTIESLPLFAFASTPIPKGDGSYILPAPKPMAKEIGTREAARLLGIHRDSMRFALETPLGREHLKWRWTSEHKKKRLFDAGSVLAYQAALRGLD